MHEGEQIRRTHVHSLSLFFVLIVVVQRKVFLPPQLDGALDDSKHRDVRFSAPFTKVDRWNWGSQRWKCKWVARTSELFQSGTHLIKFIQTAAAPRTKKEPTSDVLVNCNDSIVCLRYHNTLCILKLDVRRTN
jgi:hypothetical protein